MIQLAGWVHSNIWFFALVIPLTVLASGASIFSDRSAEPFTRAYRWAMGSTALICAILVGISKHF